VLTVNTRGYQGRVEKSAAVVSNDPGRTRISITLSVLVTPLFARPPGEDLMIHTVLNKPKELTVNLTSNYSKPIEVVGVKHTFGPQAEASFKPVEPGLKYQVTLKATAAQVFKAGGRVILELAPGSPVEAFLLPAYIDVKQ